eukprot:12317741-Alexandrium_andersonii.AAC.1
MVRQRLWRSACRTVVYLVWPPWATGPWGKTAVPGLSAAVLRRGQDCQDLKRCEYESVGRSAFGPGKNYTGGPESETAAGVCLSVKWIQ